ncbi:hypothetical protein TeGR_g9919 [Tetraparma gracilis]|uniref:Plant heme peroxidase family profile domain-containing protein n=1 Tax=Tetraparma gracilis TaxID=2962635 RepID=A0ABQ6N335_9STRA|nr:hypothetical protein TeGR_g9919 [Tetraparma gracilis]
MGAASPSASAHSSAPAIPPPSMSQVAALSAKALTQLLSSQGVPIAGAAEKRDLLDLVAANGARLARLDLGAVRSDIEGLIGERSWDDGSYGPLLIRFAWHNSGTYDRHTDTGGSNGSTMRFDAEKSDPENKGLSHAVALLEPVHAKHSFLSYADVWTLAGCVAIEASGGPRVPFSYGRVDFTPGEAREVHGPSGCPFGDGKATNPGGSRLPSADLGPAPGAPGGCPMHRQEKPTIDAMRGVFDRLGFDDRATVNLILLGHQFGRCHADVSGYEHPWYVFDPAHWNAYEHGLGYLSLYEMGAGTGRLKKRVTNQGKRQWEMNMGFGEPFMMLPTDMALWWDEAYREHVKYYDRHRRAFKEDAVVNFKRLVELGCKGLVDEL